MVNLKKSKLIYKLSRKDSINTLTETHKFNLVNIRNINLPNTAIMVGLITNCYFQKFL